MANPSYTYDPAQIFDNGINQLRFELGDTVIAQGAGSCALCDEEYISCVAYGVVNKLRWNAVKLIVLHAIMMKFSYEVDTSTEGMSFALSDRYPRWKALYDSLKAKAVIEDAAVNLNSIFTRLAGDGGHYFYAGMQANPNTPITDSGTLLSTPWGSAL